MTHETEKVYATYADVTVGAGEKTTFDWEAYNNRWYSTYTEIRKELGVMVERGEPDKIRIYQDDGDECAHIVVLDREEARRVVEVMQRWLEGEK